MGTNSKNISKTYCKPSFLKLPHIIYQRVEIIRLLKWLHSSVLYIHILTACPWLEYKWPGKLSLSRVRHNIGPQTGSTAVMSQLITISRICNLIQIHELSSRGCLGFGFGNLLIYWNCSAEAAWGQSSPRIWEFINLKEQSSRGCLGSILPLNWKFITLKEQSRRGCLGSNPSSGFVNLFINRSCPAEAARGPIPT